MNIQIIASLCDPDAGLISIKSTQFKSVALYKYIHGNMIHHH